MNKLSKCPLCGGSKVWTDVKPNAEGTLDDFKFFDEEIPQRMLTTGISNKKGESNDNL